MVRSDNVVYKIVKYLGGKGLATAAPFLEAITPHLVRKGLQSTGKTPPLPAEWASFFLDTESPDAGSVGQLQRALAAAGQSPSLAKHLASFFLEMNVPKAPDSPGAKALRETLRAVCSNTAETAEAAIDVATTASSPATLFAEKDDALQQINQAFPAAERWNAQLLAQLIIAPDCRPDISKDPGDELPDADMVAFAGWHDPDPNVLAAALGTFRQIVLSRPEVAGELASRTRRHLAADDPRVRCAALTVFGATIEKNPTRISGELATSIAKMALEDENDGVAEMARDTVLAITNNCHLLLEQLPEERAAYLHLIAALNNDTLRDIRNDPEV